MILHPERWMDLRRFRALHESGMSFSAIARETGLNWRTVKKYVNAPPPVVPPKGSSRQGTQRQVIEPFKPIIDAWLRADIKLKATVIHERLVDQYGFTGSYQRVKLYLQQARPQVAAEMGLGPDELAGLHRRFEVVPGAQAQVDWGDEGGILTHMGIKKVYSFHMVLSYSRDPFCCFTTSLDLATFWACHRRAFTHFGGVPKTIVYDRTKTVVRRHVSPGEAVPLHPEAVAFAGHYDFDIDVLAAYRPQGKGRVERQVGIVRDHVLAGRSFNSLVELDAAFASWVPLRRARVHGTHHEVIGERAARDHAALRALPTRPYMVTDRHLRHVGKDCLVAFEASLYSVPARRVRPRQLVEVRAGGDTVSLHLLTPDLTGSTLLAVHPRSHARGSWVVTEAHWDGLPDGSTRRVTSGGYGPAPRKQPDNTASTSPLQDLLSRSRAAQIPVGRRPLSVYDDLTGTRPTPSPTRPKAVPDEKDSA
ncbi:IS21 family transposase [Streptomyces sp. NBC_00006]|uniref:IS21 family transposase n=1 Tax=Streptomyces sp. NBC_00006 TaxID=2975619 RepID=UPI002259E92E|nr:IS21 family transposase [Streptomyces sp. NBC_00006]MCX5529825.1 IS21 family transposase [Streptomyces sp. NBC_00006]